MIDLDAVYTILVEECGAPDGEWDRPAFLASFELDHADILGHPLPLEYRFCGALGFGGKLRHDPHEDRWYVDCYREDETPERLEMIAHANRRLAELVRATYQEQP